MVEWTNRDKRGRQHAPGAWSMNEDRPVGMIASPFGQESTTGRFYFWVQRQALVEKTQLVRAACQVAGREITYYGIVDEVYRRSRRRTMDEEMDLFDGDVDYDPPFGPEGVTYADATILRVDPPILTPPLEQSRVMLGTEADAATAYGFGEMIDRATETDWGLPVGLIRNGGAGTIGTARIDIRDLNGDRAGHLNVTGQAGRGTKSSFLLFVVRSLIDFARRFDDGDPTKTPFSVRPVVFNVKGNDLMYIDMPNRYLGDEHRAQWERVGLDPEPFSGAEFYAPCRSMSGEINRGLPRVQRTVEPHRQTRPYYWSLADVVRLGLWEYLFSDDVQHSDTMMALADHILGLIATNRDVDINHPAGIRLRGDGDLPRSFSDLRDWLRDALQDRTHPVRDGGIHTFATCRALLSRLGLVLGQEGRTIFDEGATGHGQPLRVIKPGTTDPMVIDIAALPAELRRFVVASVLDQIKDNQMGPKRVPGQVYFVVLDELGIYAPRGARDPITRLFEHVAAQLRSQGIILLGAQQQASRVSETIFGNSEFKVLGASSPVELESPTWSRLLGQSQKTRALTLQPDEKMVLVSRGWMHVIVPFPAWAMKESEASIVTHAGPGSNGSAAFELNLPED